MAPMTRRHRPFLRDYAERALPVVQAIRDHHAALHDARTRAERDAELAALGALADAYRLLGRLDEAVRHGEEAVDLARALDRPKSLVSNLIRLATALQYRQAHADAEPLFAEARQLARQLGLLEDFALQHHGKSLAEQGRWDEAIAALEQALTLREARGDAALIASSREALTEARARAGPTAP
ncbi:MAG: tetratricopeptide repeat protein [Candidatus Sericytochromatia bacterium]|nr:tetratricopeptide repeat protein [Candidatus Sericytochromatia bacterium]